MLLNDIVIIAFIVVLVLQFLVGGCNYSLLTINSLNDSHLLADLDEGVDALVEVLTLMTG